PPPPAPAPPGQGTPASTPTTTPGVVVLPAPGARSTGSAPPERAPAPSASTPATPDAPPEEAPTRVAAGNEQTAIPAGTIVGRLDGMTALVEQVVVLGPDSVITERTRVRPETSGGST